MFDSDLTYNVGNGTLVAIPDDGQPKANYSNRGASTGTCSFLCKWTDTATICNYLLTANSATIGSYSVQVGRQHPTFANLYCTQASPSPIGKNITATSWYYARIDCTYETLQFDPANPTVLREESLEISGDVMTIPLDKDFTGLTISGTPTQDGENIYIPMLTYKVKLFQVTTCPLSAILNCMNTVNSETMTMRLGPNNTQSVTAGYALYCGIDPTKRTVTSQGVGRFDIEHTWLIAPIPHNYVLDKTKLSGAGNITVNYGSDPASGAFSLPDQLKYKSAAHSTLGV